MKRFIIVTVSIALSYHCFAESIDSLKEKRELLYQEYSEINIPGKELSEKEKLNVIEILKDLVIVDTRIIKEYKDADIELKEDALIINRLTAESESLNNEKQKNEDFLYVIYIAGATIILMLLLSLILLFIYTSKYFRLKRKQVDILETMKEADDMRIKLTKINDLVIIKNKEIDDQVLKIKKLENELLVSEEKIKRLEEGVLELQKSKQNVSSSEYDGQIEKVNINMSKIEKLGRMKELGIVTEEEFNTFKQKFLSEM